MRIVMIFLLIVIFASYNSVRASSPGIYINEVLIDPTQSVELYNSGGNDVDISGWHIDDSGGTTYFTVPPLTTLPSQRCIVFTSAFSFNKSTTDTARLFDATAAPTDNSPHLVDSFTYAVSPGPNKSFQRIPDGEPIWATAPASLGSLNLDNTPCVAVVSPPPTPSPALEPAEEVPEPVNNVFISEANVNPLNSTEEWVELYNNNEWDVTLDGWFIDDILSGGASKVEFSRVIPARSYSLIELDTSLFNNNGDEINLLNNNNQLMDSVVYTSSVKGMTVGRSDLLSVSACIMNPSLTLQNTPCILPTLTPTPSPNSKGLTPTMIPEPKDKAISISPRNTAINQIAAVSKSGNKKQISKTPDKTSAKSTAHKKSKTEFIGTDEPRKIARTLSFSSLTASVLTIISMLFKMRGE